MYDQVIEQIKKYSTIIIFRHKNPDGDALGSQIGLKHIIKASFPDKTVYTVGDATKRYAFMDDSQMDEISDDTFKGSLGIILDTPEIQMICDDRYSLCDFRVKMDHHIFCEKFADIEIVDTSCESCCSLVTDFAVQTKLNIPDIAAKSLYTGITTDSGRFKYDSTSSKTFALASELLKRNFSISEIYSNLYTENFSDLQVRADFINRIKFTKKNVAYVYTTLRYGKKLARKYKLDTFGASRGMVNVMADIQDVHIWVNFTETENTVLVELRSDKYNINPIAVKYGGGGHAKASGCDVKNYKEAMQLLSDCEKLMEEN